MPSKNAFQIPFHDFGGRGPTIHFAHANGFLPGSYQQFINPLLDHYRVVGPILRPAWPHSKLADVPSWEVIADDLITFLEQQQLSNIIGMGHSLGAVSTMLAAHKRPDLFRSLILIEPVFLPPVILNMIALTGQLVVSRIPFVRIAKNRRYQWKDRADAFDYFRKKSVFKLWSDAAIWDYVNHSMRETDEGITLTYSREFEAHIYTRVPRVWRQLSEVSIPTLAVRAEHSDSLYKRPWRKWQRVQKSATFVEFQDVGHMVPMQAPLKLAHTVHEYLNAQLELSN